MIQSRDRPTGAGRHPQLSVLLTVGKSSESALVWIINAFSSTIVSLISGTIVSISVQVAAAKVCSACRAGRCRGEKSSCYHGVVGQPGEMDTKPPWIPFPSVYFSFVSSTVAHSTNGIEALKPSKEAESRLSIQKKKQNVLYASEIPLTHNLHLVTQDSLPPKRSLSSRATTSSYWPCGLAAGGAGAGVGAALVVVVVTAKTRQSLSLLVIVVVGLTYSCRSGHQRGAQGKYSAQSPRAASAAAAVVVVVVLYHAVSHFPDGVNVDALHVPVAATTPHRAFAALCSPALSPIGLLLRALDMVMWWW